jgi:hypothetical protein
MVILHFSSGVALSTTVRDVRTIIKRNHQAARVIQEKR